jgi:hypothetical protein
VAEPVQHLKALTPNATPIWGSLDEAAMFFENDEAKLQRALRACFDFHGDDQDIVIVRVRRIKTFRGLRSSPRHVEEP